MSTTTMGQTPGSSRAQAQTTSESITWKIREVWWATLGLFAIAGEESERLFSALVRKGREVEPVIGHQFEKVGKGVGDAVGEVGVHFKGVGEKFGKASGKMESFVDERVSAALNRMGVASKDEIESLSEKVDELGDKIEELRSKLGAAKGDSKAEG